MVPLPFLFRNNNIEALSFPVKRAKPNLNTWLLLVSPREPNPIGGKPKPFLFTLTKPKSIKVQLVSPEPWSAAAGLELIFSYHFDHLIFDTVNSTATAPKQKP